MKKNKQNTIIVTFLLLIVSLFNFQFYFEKAAKSENSDFKHYRFVSQHHSEEVILSQDVELSEEDETETEGETGWFHFEQHLLYFVSVFSDHQNHTAKAGLSHIPVITQPLYIFHKLLRI